MKLVVELDGFSHDVQAERDVSRDGYMRDEGYRVLRFPNEDVMGNAEGVVAAIREAIGRLAHP